MCNFSSSSFSFFCFKTWISSFKGKTINILGSFENFSSSFLFYFIFWNLKFSFEIESVYFCISLKFFSSLHFFQNLNFSWNSNYLFLEILEKFLFFYFFYFLSIIHHHQLTWPLKKGGGDLDSFFFCFFFFTLSSSSILTIHRFLSFAFSSFTLHFLFGKSLF